MERPSTVPDRLAPVHQIHERQRRINALLHDSRLEPKWLFFPTKVTVATLAKELLPVDADVDAEDK